MIKLERIYHYSYKLKPFIYDFIVKGGEFERTSDQIISQISMALEHKNSAVWLIKKGEEICGYIFVEVLPTEYGTKCVLVHQMACNLKNGFKVWKQLAKVLFDFGGPLGATEIFFLTRRDPNAFIRLMNDGWEIDSFILRRRKENVPRETFGYIPSAS